MIKEIFTSYISNDPRHLVALCFGFFLYGYLNFIGMDKIKPFSNGTDFEIWENKNCCQCNISSINRDDLICHIEEAITIAYLDDGKLEKTLFDKIGKDDKGFFKNCPYKNAYSIKLVKINTIVFKHKQLSIF